MYFATIHGERLLSFGSFIKLYHIYVWCSLVVKCLCKTALRLIACCPGQLPLFSSPVSHATDIDWVLGRPYLGWIGLGRVGFVIFVMTIKKG